MNQARHEDGGQALPRRGSHPVGTEKERQKVPLEIVDTFIRIPVLSRSEPST